MNAMLVFLPPSEELLPALRAYRQECLAVRDSLDGAAGLKNFPDLSDWLARIRLLASPSVSQRGWFRTEVFLAVRIVEGCSLAARRAADPDFLPELVGLGNVRFPGDSGKDRADLLFSGHIGYHVRPTERGKGYGSALLAHAVEVCRKGGVSEPAVSIAPDNLPSLRTARSAGFLPEAEETLANGETILRLRLPAVE